MSRLSRRVERLECQQPSKGSSPMWYLRDLFAKTDKLRTWLRERGHADTTGAAEAGEKCPAGLEEVWTLMLRVDLQRRCRAYRSGWSARLTWLCCCKVCFDVERRLRASASVSVSPPAP